MANLLSFEPDDSFFVDCLFKPPLKRITNQNAKNYIFDFNVFSDDNKLEFVAQNPYLPTCPPIVTDSHPLENCSEYDIKSDATLSAEKLYFCFDYLCHW